MACTTCLSCDDQSLEAELQQLGLPKAVELRMKYTDNSQSETLGSASTPDEPKPLKSVSFSLSDDKLRALDHELRYVSALMESFQ